MISGLTSGNRRTWFSVHELCPDVSEGVMNFIGCGIDTRVAETVHRIGRMHLGLPQVAPGTGNALLEKLLMELPEPLPGVFVEHVDETGVAEVKVESVRLAGDATREHVVVDGVLPVRRRAQYEGLR